MADVERIFEEMIVLGTKSGTKILRQAFKDDFAVTQFQSGSIQLASGVASVITVAAVMANARVAIFNCSVSTTITWEDSQKINADGLQVVTQWDKKSVANQAFSALQTSGSVATLDFMIAGN